MKHAQRSRRHWFSILVTGFLFAGISLTANAENQPTTPNAKSSHPGNTVRRTRVVNYSPKSVKIEGAFGLKLGDVFTPKKGQKPLSTTSEIVQEEKNRMNYTSGILPNIYEVKPSKPINIFQHYYVCLAPGEKRIYKIIATYASSDPSEKMISKYFKLLSFALSQKYPEMPGSSSNNLRFFYVGNDPRSNLRWIGNGNNMELKLDYVDYQLFNTAIQKLWSELNIEALKKSGIDTSAL